MRGGVDNAAHIGGLLSGIVIGYAFYPSLLKPDATLIKQISLAVIITVTGIFSVFMYTNISNPIGEYNTRMQDFYDRQTAALRIYELPEGTPKEQLLASIKDTGIVYWKKNLQLVKEVDKLDLPEDFHAKNKKLIQYCDLRVKSYKLIYKAYTENTAAYESQIQTYYKEIDKVLQDINGTKETKN